MVGIIDYDAGNIKSVENALHTLGEEVIVTSNADTLLACDHVILPGVGHFGHAMEKLKARGLDQVIHQIVAQKIPLMGICLGLQLLFESSEEAPGVDGLGVLAGTVVAIPKVHGLKVPHMGWNGLRRNDKNNNAIHQPKGIRQEVHLMDGLTQVPYVYFVHSYYLKATDRHIVAASADYGVTIDAAIEAGNVWACQFHPEKSGEVGMQMLRNFLSL